MGPRTDPEGPTIGTPWARRCAVERQAAVPAFVVGQAAECACLDRAAPLTLDHRGAVGGAEEHDRALLGSERRPFRYGRASGGRAKLGVMRLSLLDRRIFFWPLGVMRR
jgi:hypothetical protein